MIRFPLFVVKRLNLPCCLVLVFVSACSLRGQTFTWDGGATDDNFGSAANWNPDGAPGIGSGVTLNFTGSTRPTPFCNYGNGNDFGAWYLLSGASVPFTISGTSGNTYGLYSKIENQSSSLFTIKVDNLAARANIELNPVNGDLTITNGGSIYLDNNRSLTVWGDNVNLSRTLTLDTILSQGNGTGGSGSLVVNQKATVILKGANTYGNTTINSGTVQVGAGGTSGTLGSGLVSNNIAGGSSLVFNRSDAITVNNQIWASAPNSPTVVHNGIGTTTLAGTADNISVGATVNNGVLILGKAPSSSSVHALGGNTTIASGATLKLGGSGGDQIFTGVSLTNNGAFDLAGLNEGFDGFNGSGIATNSSASAATMTVGESGASSSFSGVIKNGAGTINLTKSGNGTQTLSGANTYSGVTTINAGTLTLAGGNDRLPVGTTVAFGGPATLNIGGNSQTISKLNPANTAPGVTNSVTSGTLTINGAQDLIVNGGLNQTLDLSGLSAFTYSQSANQLKVQPTTAANATTNELFLAKNGSSGGVNSITASAVQVGAASGSSANDLHMGKLHLGTTNTFNSASFAIGGFNGRGAVDFQSGIGASPVLTLRNTGGASTRMTTLKVGETSSGVRAGDGVLDLTGGIVDAIVQDVQVGRHIAGANNNDTSTLTMPGGSLDASTLTLAEKIGTGTPTLTSTFNQGGGTVKVLALNMGRCTNDTQSPVLKPIYNLNGGILSASNIIVVQGGLPAAGSDRNLNWNSGTISNYDASTDLRIAGVTMNGQLKINLATAGTHSFNLAASRTAVVESSAVLTGASALSKDGAGALVLNGGNAGYTGKTTVNAGRLVAVANDNALGAAPGSVTADQLTLNGGTISLNRGWNGTFSGFSAGLGYTNFPAVSLSQVSGAKVLAVGGLTVGAVIPVTSQGGSISACTVSFTLPDITNGVVPTATATISGNQVTQVTINTSGSGYTSVPQMFFTITRSGGSDAVPPAVNAITLTGLTLVNAGYDYTGTAPTVSFSGGGGSGAAATANNTATATISLAANRGITIGASGGTIDDPVGSTIAGDITGAGALTKTGAGTLVLAGALGNAGNINLSAGAVRLNRNAAYTLAQTFSGAGQLRINQGTINITSSSFTPQVDLGVDVNASPVVNWSGTGTLNNLFINDQGAACNPALNIVSGGTLTVAGNTSTAAYPWYLDSFFFAGKGPASLSVTNGGILTINSNKRIVFGLPKYGGTFASGPYPQVGTIDIFTGSLMDAQGTADFWLGYAQDNADAKFASTGTVRLDGGTLQTSRTIKEYVDSGALAPATTIAFNGGTLKAGSTDNATWIDASLDTVTLEAGGGTIDTAGRVMTIPHAITGAGALTKIGAGTLTLTAGNSYSGSTAMSGGTLALSGSGSLASSNISVAVGTTLDVSAISGSSYTLPAGLLTFNINKNGSTVTQGQIAAGSRNIIHNGTLTVAASGSTLVNGDSFNLITTTGSRSGWFASVSLPGLSSGLAWDTNHLATAGTLDVYAFAIDSLSFAAAVGKTATIPASKLASRLHSIKNSSTFPTNWIAAVSGVNLGSASIDGSGNLVYAPTNAGTDTFTVTFYDGHGWQNMSVTATVAAANVGPALLGVDDGTGHYKITTSGAPGANYNVEAKTLDGGVWSAWGTAATVTADQNGVITWTDSEAISVHDGKLYRLAQQ